MRVHKYCCVHIIAPPPRFPPKPGRNGQKPNRVRPGPCPPHPILTSTKYTHQSRIRARPRHRAHTPGFASGPNPMKLSEIQVQPWGLVWTHRPRFGSAAHVSGLPPHPRPWLPLQPNQAAPGQEEAEGTKIGHGCTPEGVSVKHPVHQLFVIIFSIL